MSSVTSVVYAFLNRASCQIVSGSRSFKISSATISPIGRPMLEPVPRASAHDPHVLPPPDAGR